MRDIKFGKALLQQIGGYIFVFKKCPFYGFHGLILGRFRHNHAHTHTPKHTHVIGSSSNYKDHGIIVKRKTKRHSKNC